jgi:hypothetical protein
MVMPDMPPASAPARLQLTLQRSASGSTWLAELHELGAPRRFESLPELVAWLNTLEHPPSAPARPALGIR